MGWKRILPLQTYSKFKTRNKLWFFSFLFFFMGGGVWWKTLWYQFLGLWNSTPKSHMCYTYANLRNGIGKATLYLGALTIHGRSSNKHMAPIFNTFGMDWVTKLCVFPTCCGHRIWGSHVKGTGTIQWTGRTGHYTLLSNWCGLSLRVTCCYIYFTDTTTFHQLILYHILCVCLNYLCYLG
jgi:hypothetical protein